jgi:hypothetical protein
MPQARVVRQPLVIGLLALAVPGLGHALLGRPRRGAAFLVIVTIAFGVGLVLDGRLPVVDRAKPLSFLAAVTTTATGFLNAAARAAGWGSGDIRSATFEYGTTYLLSAGLMNLLLVLDAVDRARTIAGPPRSSGS